MPTSIKKIDFTLAYDYAVLGNGAVPEAIARAITVPALVMDGEKTMDFIHPTCDRLAKLMPRSQRKTLAGQTHQVNADATAPVLIAFFTVTVAAVDLGEQVGRGRRRPQADLVALAVVQAPLEQRVVQRREPRLAS